MMQLLIAPRIKAYRYRHHLSRRDFGELMGVSPQAVCKWETGLCCPDIMLLPALSRVLGCMIDDLFAEGGV